jgi:hypothetical protein
LILIPATGLVEMQNIFVPVAGKSVPDCLMRRVDSL